MAWFWQRKKEEKEKQSAQASAQASKSGLLERLRPAAAPRTTGKIKAAKKSATAPAKSAAPFTDSYRVVLGPIVTEKSARLAEQGTYVFAITRQANKIQVSRAISSIYHVTPIKVTVASVAGKPKVFAQRLGYRGRIRKAYVTLKAGQTIELYKEAGK